MDGNLEMANIQVDMSENDMNELHESLILELTHERETWLYLASGLTQEHQQKVRNELLSKANSLQQQINELEGKQ